MVVLSTGLLSFTTPGEDISRREIVFPSCTLDFFGLKIKISIGLGEGVPRKGVKDGRKGTKKNIFFNFFYRTCGSEVN